MALFSQRIGKTPIKTVLQIESMDDDLRNSLWNVIKLFFLDEVKASLLSNSSFQIYFIFLWRDFLKLPLDTMDDYYENTYKQIRKWFFGWEWFKVYDFIEFSAKFLPDEKFIKLCNEIFTTELSGYRFIEKTITPIADKNEIEEIERAIENSKKTKLSGVHTHLLSALEKLSDRKNPDYRNSIKESISAVESISKIISNNPKAELKDALKPLKDKINLHPALEKGFLAIYGYTSDAGGIRHGMIDNHKSDFADAKYMLVSCSAFVNYLVMKTNNAGIKI